MKGSYTSLSLKEESDIWVQLWTLFKNNYKHSIIINNSLKFSDPKMYKNENSDKKFWFIRRNVSYKSKGVV